MKYVPWKFQNFDKGALFSKIYYYYMWPFQAKAITWVHLKIWILSHFLNVYILNNILCEFEVIPVKNGSRI